MNKITNIIQHHTYVFDKEEISILKCSSSMLKNSKEPWQSWFLMNLFVFRGQEVEFLQDVILWAYNTIHNAQDQLFILHEILKKGMEYKISIYNLLVRKF